METFNIHGNSMWTFPYALTADESRVMLEAIENGNLEQTYMMIRAKRHLAKHDLPTHGLQSFVGVDDYGFLITFGVVSGSIAGESK